MRKRFIRFLATMLVLSSIMTPMSVDAYGFNHGDCVLAHLDIPLSYEIQHYIYELSCEYNVDPILVMAIIQKESKCDPNTVGDSGNAIGLMQIQRKWHNERICRLKCDDMYDPYQNILVGMDYLAELYEGDMTTEWVLMAYNGGRTWANKHARIGYTTKYAREVLDIMDEFYEMIEDEYAEETVE